MRKHFLALTVGALVLAMTVGVGATVAGNAKGKDKEPKGGIHNLDGPFSQKQRALKQRAAELKLAGKVKKGQKVARVAKGQYVELAREGSDRIFVVLAEFGDTRHSAYPDTIGGEPASDALTFNGPARNSIPAPDRTVDNSTLWQKDYSQAHYKDMYFNRMAKYYESQSSGRYSVTGDVTAWVRVPFNEARYGRNVCGDIVCNNTWFLIRDALSSWVKGQLDSGVALADVTKYLQTFDEWDRYDSDGDGNFDEPDGFIDHFQIVHAGGDEASGDPQQGTDAIWSHRWYAQVTGGGPNGFPGVNVGSGGVSSGVTIPSNPTGVWVGDYTIQPENGGLGVFAHEFGHDLDLPDLYDTSGNTGGAENSTGFWTLMSSGANIGDGGANGIGDAPTDLGAWEKFMLGWMDPQGNSGPFYDVAYAGKKSEHKLGPNNSATKQAQALFVVLPPKQVPLLLGAPCPAVCGTSYFYSGSGNDLSATMTKSGITGTALTAKVRYAIEEEWDYAFLEASNGGAFTPVATNLSDKAADHANPAEHYQSGFNTSDTGITGSSAGQWVDLTATLPVGTTAIRFHYVTDGAVSESGFQVDNITIGTTQVGTAEASEGWVFDGFRTTTGTEEQSFFNAYVAENRGYRGYDTSLKTAYNFGFANTRPDWLEFYPYQDGLLISYWNAQYADPLNPIRGENNVGDHPGEGLILPIDAHPQFFHHADGQLMRGRVASFDSTFGLEPTDAITITKDSVPVTIPSRPAVPVFDDTKDWWFNADEHAATGSHVGRHQPGWLGVKVPKTGTTIRVKSVSAQGSMMQVEVKPAK